MVGVLIRSEGKPIMKRSFFTASGRPHDPRARAAAIVEFAVVLPLLITILFGIIEYGWVFMVRQTLQHAAREACRTAVLTTATDADIDARITEIMATTHVVTYTATKTHANGPCQPIETVTLSVPYSDISLTGGFFGTTDYNLVGSSSMRKEGLGPCP